MMMKHCQRHNGPEGWVQLSCLITCLGHTTSSNTNLYQISSISTNHQHYRLNSKFKILTTPSFRISTKIQLHNLYKTSAAKYWQNSSFKSCLDFNFKILTKLFDQNLNKHLDFWPNLGFQIRNKLLPTRSSSATVTTSTSFELASSHARVTSKKFT